MNTIRASERVPRSHGVRSANQSQECHQLSHTFPVPLFAHLVGGYIEISQAAVLQYLRRHDTPSTQVKLIIDLTHPHFVPSVWAFIRVENFQYNLGSRRAYARVRGKGTDHSPQSLGCLGSNSVLGKIELFERGVFLEDEEYLGGGLYARRPVLAANREVAEGLFCKHTRN